MLYEHPIVQKTSVDGRYDQHSYDAIPMLAWKMEYIENRKVHLSPRLDFKQTYSLSYCSFCNFLRKCVLVCIKSKQSIVAVVAFAALPVPRSTNGATKPSVMQPLRCQECFKFTLKLILILQQ